MKALFGSNFLELINSRNSSLFFYILLATLLLFGVILGITNRLDLADSAIFSGDMPSYLLFPLNSLTEAFSSHRTFVFPLLLQGYKLIDHDLTSLPIFLYILYSLVLIFLYRSVLSLGFKPIIALAISISFLMNASFITGLTSLTAETLVSILMVLILGMLFRLHTLSNYINLSILSILIFLLYQTKPNLAPIIILVPIWLFLFNFYLRGFSLRTSSILGFTSLLINSFLLLTFLSIRMFTVGEFGMNSFSGTVLSGQATSYLDEKIVTELKGTPRILGSNILQKKALLSAPCNKDKDNLTHQDRHECGNVWIMTSWLEAIKHFDKEEPFQEENLNIEPWLHDQLGTFFSRNNVVIDNTLKDYGIQVIQKEPKLAFSRMLYEYKFALKYFLTMFATDIVYVASIGFLVISWLFKKRLREKKEQINQKELYGMKEFHLFLVMMFIAITFMLQVILVAGAMLHLDNRYIASSCIFFLCPILLFSLLPYLIKNSE